MSASPTVLVVIPCYNLGQYLEEAVDSVLQQTYQDFEIVVVDDGSDDEETKAVFDSFDRPKTRLVRQANAGVAAARNNAIRMSEASFVCCLDADDRYCPEFLERTVPVLEKNGDVGFVTTWYRHFGDDDSVIEYGDCELPRVLVQNKAMVSALFRREAWEKAGGYAEELPRVHDWDLWIGILENGYRAEVLEEVLFEYRKRRGSMYMDTRQAEHFGPVMRMLVERHRETYMKYLPDVVATMGYEWAAQICEHERMLKHYHHEKALVERYRSVMQSSGHRFLNWIGGLLGKGGSTK